jgi:two-component system, response regulator, stage 0 sporulation protein F
MHRAILLVDDDPVMLALIARILREAAPDYELLSIANSTAALALMAQRSIALVITDQHMPDMDGVALTVATKAVAPLCPVILMTGTSTDEIQLRADAAGVDYFLPKPFGFDQLATIVRAALAPECAYAAAAAAQRRLWPSETKRSLPMKPAIIVVDDETALLALLERVLAPLAPDYQILSVMSGAAALALLAQRPIALVITDYRMPDMDGVVLAKAIKAVAPHCPIMLMTGSGTHEIEQHGQAVGVEYFLPKPFRLDDFRAIVRAALAQERAVGDHSNPAV